MKNIIITLIVSFMCGIVKGQGQSFAIVDGSRVELRKVVFVKNEKLEGYGYYNYTADGVVFFKHGYVVETGPGKNDYRKGNFIHGLLEGEGEEQTGDLKYTGSYVNDMFDGIGKLVNVNTGKRHLGYFRAGKFIRPMKRTIPYLNPNVFLDSGGSMVNSLFLKTDSDPFKSSNE